MALAHRVRVKALLVAKAGPYYEHQRVVMRALALGMAQHGIEARVEVPSASRITDEDFVVTWGNKNPLQANGVPHLILECGYINGTAHSYTRNRLRYISASWNQRHGLSDWSWSQKVNGERWQALGIELQPWKQDGEYALLLEQLPWDKAAPPVGKFRRSITAECARREWPILVRHHPSLKRSERTLNEDLADASLAITWCSTASVEAVIAGVPTYALGPGSIAAPVTRQALSEPPYRGDRIAWANRLAYRQWALAELADGSAWPHIHDGIQGRAA